MNFCLGVGFGIMLGFLIAGGITKQARETGYKIDGIIQQCEATLPRNQSCKIVLSTEVVTDVVDNPEK